MTMKNLAHTLRDLCDPRINTRAPTLAEVVKAMEFLLERRDGKTAK